MNTSMKPLAAVLLSMLIGGAAWASDRVNINTADADTLNRVLTNVGPSKAEAIVEHRKEHGAFRSAEQLAMVKGIGLRTVELNRARIELGAEPSRTPAGGASAAAAAAAPSR